MLHRIGVMIAAAVLVTVPAAAQDERPVHVNIGGGYTGVYGAAKDRVGNGGNFTFGVIFKVAPVVSLQGEYGWTGIGEKNIKIPLYPTPAAGTGVPTDFFADGTMHYGNFNVLFHPSSGKAQPYFLTGLGIYNRNVQVTTPGVGYATICDPWWYVCYPTLVPVDQIVGERGSTDFGMNFGGGVNVKLTDNTSFFAEIRYHYIWGSEIDQSKIPAGVTLNETKATGQFLPITFGFRF